MTPTTLAETILRDVPRFDIYEGDTLFSSQGTWVTHREVLAALTAAMDPSHDNETSAIAERAGEVLEGVTPYDGDQCGCEYCADSPAALWRNGEAICRDCLNRQIEALVPALLAQNAALRAERDALAERNKENSRLAEDNAQGLREAEAVAEKLRGALEKAANRLDWAAGIIVTEKGRDQASAWAQEARAALTETATTEETHE